MDSTRPESLGNNASDEFAWITEQRDGLRWATRADLPRVVRIALDSFGWHIGPDVLERLWAQKVDLRTLAVAESDGSVRGFVEVLRGRDLWRAVSGVPFPCLVHELVARRLLCNELYSRRGPYLFLTAVASQAKLGTGARIFRTFQRHHEVLSLMYDREDHRLGGYYRALGFSPDMCPLPLPWRWAVDRRYRYAMWRSGSRAPKQASAKPPWRRRG